MDDDCSNIFSLFPREPELAGGGGRDVELGPGENDGGETNFEGLADALLNEGGATLVSMATDPVQMYIMHGCHVYTNYWTEYDREHLHFYFKLTF